jgi:hypothetical protein
MISLVPTNEGVREYGDEHGDHVARAHVVGQQIGGFGEVHVHDGKKVDDEVHSQRQRGEVLEPKVRCKRTIGRVSGLTSHRNQIQPPYDCFFVYYILTTYPGTSVTELTQG